MLKPQVETLKEIFHSARERPAEKRKAFLDQACGEDDELRQQVDALLESDRAGDDFIGDLPARLVADAFGGSPDPSDTGRMIGQYKLLESIGSGGMGVVYLAERADQQFKMQVAIKLIKRGMDTDQVLRRFQHERQILASLEHPNNARLLDGGTTDDGLPSSRRAMFGCSSEARICRSCWKRRKTWSVSIPRLISLIATCILNCWSARSAR